MSEAVSILLTSCDRGCNPRIVFGGARIVLISTVQHFWLVTLPISVYPSAQDDEAGMFGEMAGQPPFPRQKEDCKLQASQNAPLKTWCKAYGVLLTILASFTLKPAGLEYD